MDCEIKKEEDGFYHPETEEQIICLVKKAYEEGLQVRCRGAAHSIAWAIYTDPGKGNEPLPNKVSHEEPPSGPNINIMLDRFTGLEWEDEKNGIVIADAGIHLGIDPRDPAGKSTLENGLLYQAFQKGFALNDLGGITHQTVSGFLTTGSAGGSLTFDLSENIIGFRIIDGKGDIQWLNKPDDGDNNNIFYAISPSLGLLGIITKVKFKLNKMFNIYGNEMTTPTDPDKCPIDLFGPGSDKKPSMQTFLEKTHYTRILWWPQKGVNRIVTWQATRGNEPAAQGFNPVPYEEFKNSLGGQLEQLLGAVFFTLLGNKGFSNIWGKLGKDFNQFKSNLRKIGKSSTSPFPAIFTTILQIILFFVVLFFSIFRQLLLSLYPAVVGVFEPLTKQGEQTTFQDYYWRSLPMDNTADDILMGTEFTEIWVPLQHTEKSMKLLNEMYKEKGFAGTDYFSTELYAGYPSKNWLSPSFTDGKDEFKDGTFRIDVFWYINNEGSPDAEGGFYQQFWDLFSKNNIPFRLHWGKFIPGYDFAKWADYYKSQLPKLDQFLKLRVERDPKNIFLTDYWKKHLNIET
jgi:hypothetical protein